MLNAVFIIGRLGDDPVIKTLAKSDTLVAQMSIASTDIRNEKEYVEWHNVVVYGKMAEVCGKYLTKGDLIFIQGRNQTTRYEKDGQRKYWHVIVATAVKFLNTKGFEKKAAETEAGTETKSSEEDVPF